MYRPPKSSIQKSTRTQRQVFFRSPSEASLVRVGQCPRTDRSLDDQHWGETDNLRVWFSGGQGSDRADGRILESLQSDVYRGSQTTRLLVTEDRELLAQAQGRGAIGVSPLEMWAMVG
jgi:hypothetical protein